MHSRTNLHILAARAALVLLTGLAAGPASATPNLDTFRGCGLEGTATSPCARALNRLKNRYRSPRVSQINHAISLAALLAGGDDLKRWKSSDGAEFKGLVASVDSGGKRESCNCGRDDLRDIHINVVARPEDVGHLLRYFIVEITPRMQRLNPEWTFERIDHLEGQWVTFQGWMLFDGMHSRESQNTHERPKQACGTLKVRQIWRATAWEIHPVTSWKLATGPH